MPDALSASRPSRRAAALIDFGLDTQLVGVFGETRRADDTADPQAGDLTIRAAKKVS